jgi:GDPmannose 4,6-dehydratase
MHAPRTALITGITGQDGSYLAELLLQKGYEVHGLVRRTSADEHPRIRHLEGKITLWPGDLLDQTSLNNLLFRVRPQEIYHLAAQSFVGTSWQQPILTCEVTGLGTVRLLEAMRLAVPSARFYQASSSEQFGLVRESPQRETTPFYPRSPYGVAKVFAHYATVNYRESYDFFACCGILFNHESPRRGKEFVTRRISQGVAEIAAGLSSELRLGNLAARRDWGFAGDYVEAMWLMLQQDEPDDYVVGTGETHSVEEFAQLAFAHVDLDWQSWVTIDPALTRPAEVELLLADPAKTHRKLGWKPRVHFRDLVKMMVDADVAELRRQGAAVLSFPSRRLSKTA